MAMQQLTLPGEIVKKHNALVRSRLGIVNVQAARILASLIAQIEPDTKDFSKPYNIEIKNFIPNDSGRSYSEIKSICRELAKSFAEFEIESNNGSITLVEFPFFSRLMYQHGKVEAVFNDAMRDSLLELKGHFTKYNLIEYLKLPSIYSQRVFEILKSWDDKEEVTISLESLHTTLNTPESLRVDFSQFRRRVLEKSHKDIISKTDFKYEWEAIKQGRSVVAVRFIFGKKRAIAISKVKETEKQEKKSKQNNKDFLAALACRKERGPACEGGRQKESVCELCRRISG